MDFMLSILSGLGSGVVLSLMLGTVFFALLKDGLQHGYKAGLSIGMGVIITDLIFIFLAYAFTDFTASFIESNKKSILLLSGAFIVLLGIFGFFGKQPTHKQEEADDFSFIKLFLKGAVLNGSNPVNFFAWLSLQSLLLAKETTPTNFWAYFTACLVAIFIMEVGFGTLAKAISTKLNSKLLKNIKTAVNVVFIILGLIVLVQGI